MRPATRSSSGAAMEGRSGVSNDGSWARAAVSGRAPQQQVVMKKVQPTRDLGSRSAPGPPRDQSGRFIRGGSKVGKSIPALVSQNRVAPLLDTAVDLVQHVAAEDKEVSGSESEEGDQVSSSGNSGFDCEGVGVLAEQLELDSSHVTEGVFPVAGHLFVEMPQSGPCAVGSNLGEVSLGEPKGMAMEVVGGSVLPRIGPMAPHVKLGGVDPVRPHVDAVGEAHRAPWVNLFKDNRNMGKGLKLDEWEIDGDTVLLEEVDVDVVEDVWGFCLVGLFAGKYPGMAAVRKLRDGWKVNCSHWRHRSGWFIFKFQSEEDRRKVLEGGPYFAFGSNLLLKCLPSCFRFEGEDVSSVPIWIQLPGLPLDCWNARALGKIVSKVGKPITTDNLTLTKERLSFARVLVEVDTSSDVVSEVEIRLPTGVVYRQMVLAESTPKFCKNCKTFGHLDVACGLGAEGRKHTVFVAKRRLQNHEGSVRLSGGGSLGVKEGAPSALGTACFPPVVVPLFGVGAGQSSKGISQDMGEDKRPEVEVNSVDLESVDGGGPDVVPAVPVEDTRLWEATACPPVTSTVGVGAAASFGKQPFLPAVQRGGNMAQTASAGQSSKDTSLAGQQGAAVQQLRTATCGNLGGNEAGDLLPVDTHLATDHLQSGVGSACLEDGGWTTVGKKGKKFLKTGQPGLAAVQHLPVGDGSQGEHVGELELMRSDEETAVVDGKVPDSSGWAEGNELVPFGGGYISKEILMKKGRRYCRRYYGSWR